MKKLLYLIAFLVIGSGTAYSQVREKNSKRPFARNNDLAWMQKNLNLNTKQREQIKKLYQERFNQEQKIREINKKHLRKNQNLRAAHMKSHRARLEKILSKDQMVALQKHKNLARIKGIRSQIQRKFYEHKDFPRAERQRLPRGSR